MTTSKEEARRRFDVGKSKAQLIVKTVLVWLSLVLLVLAFPSVATAQLPGCGFWVIGDDIYCSNWTPNATLTVTIMPGGFQAATFTDGVGLGIFVDVYHLQAGQRLTVTDGVKTFTYTVANVVVTRVDTCNDTVSGTADPGTTVFIQPWLDGRVPRQTTVADSSGHWTVDYRAIGFDILRTDQGSAEQRTMVFPIYTSTTYPWYAGPCVEGAGEIVSYAGDVTVNDVGVRDLASLNLQLLDKVRTFADGHVDMKFGESTVHLNSNSEVRIGENTTPAATTLDELKGALFARVRNLSAEYMEVRTPVSVSSVRGTEMLVEASQAETRITMLEHDADVSTLDGRQSIILRELESVVVTAAGIGEPFPVSPNEVERGWERMVISVASPVNLYVTDPLGRRVGFSPTGVIVNEIPGAIYSGPLTVPEVIDIPAPARGGYQIVLTADGAGDYHLTIAGLGMGDETFFNEYRGTVELDETVSYEQDLEAADEPLTLKIDIKPGTFPNDVNLKSRGVIPVAVLTNEHFDARTVDCSTVRFGATGTEAAPAHFALEDVDGDGDFDLIFQFRTENTGILPGATSAYLRGFVLDKEFVGYDSITIVGSRKR
jgi:hypothetical protein